MDNPDEEHPSFRSTLKVETRAISSSERKKLLDKARDRARDPDIFDEEGHEPFFWTARASNQTVDSYFTKMNENSLQNYVDDATDPGVQFQNSHNVREVGFGRSLGGVVTGRSGAKEALIDFYAIRGLSAGGMLSDQFIDGVRAGIYNDVSIGFTPGKMICNICGNDWLRKWDWIFDDTGTREETCTHWPGKEYETERGKKPVVCILDVQEARLNEVSLVYDGATPGAGIAAVDAARMASATGKLPETDRMFLEGLYQYRIAPPPGLHRGVELDLEKIRAMTDPKVEDNNVTVVDPQPTVRKTALRSGKPEKKAADDSLEPMERLRAKFGEQLGELGDDPYEVIETLAERVIAQDGEIVTLTTEAEYGREAREAILKELDGTVVRAFGADENTKGRQERYRRMVKEMSMDDVRVTIDELEQRAVSRIGKGGQHITLEDGKEEGDPATVADRKAEKRGRTPAHLV